MSFHQQKHTDWDAYYSRPYISASITRRFSANNLVRIMKQHGNTSSPMIMEIGGANSCFFDTLCERINPSIYAVFDLNETGLRKFKERTTNITRTKIEILHGDILCPEETRHFDIVFSVGLIEHFDTAATKMAFLNHLNFLKPGGLLIVAFPTPTILYRMVRWAAELTGQWIFLDERPIDRKEAMTLLPEGHTLLEYKILWPLILTQAVMVSRQSTVPLPQHFVKN